MIQTKQKQVLMFSIVTASILLTACGNNGNESGETTTKTQRSSEPMRSTEVQTVDEVGVETQNNATNEEIVDTEDNESTDSEEVLMMDDDLDDGGVL